MDTHGATTSNYVGAHTTHVNAQITCAICHGPNPGATGHNLDGPRAQVVFTGVATNGGAFTTSYDPSTFTCTVYCHGGSLSGGADTTPSWPDGSLTGGCGACHGDEAYGQEDIAPNLVDGKFLGAAGDLPDAAYFAMIKGGSDAKKALGRPGVPDGGMAAFGGDLSDEDIWSIVAWLRNQKAHEAAEGHPGGHQ